VLPVAELEDRIHALLTGALTRALTDAARWRLVLLRAELRRALADNENGAPPQETPR
jgi:hypothetical protein